MATDTSTASRQRVKSRVTRRSVLISDAIANWVIRIGGLGVILAVFGIMVFLVDVVRPLFSGAHLVGQHEVTLKGTSGRVLSELVDEYTTIIVSVEATGEVVVNDLGSGRLLKSNSFLTGDRKVTAFAHTLRGDDVAFGFDDGTLRLGRIKIFAEILSLANVPSGLTKLSGDALTDGEAVYVPIENDQVRKLSVSVTLEEPQRVAPEGTALIAVDYRLGGTVERPTTSFVSIDANGAVRLSRLETKRNLLTGKELTSLSSVELPSLPAGTDVASVLMTSQADQVYIAEKSGWVSRYDARDPSKATVAERIRLTPEGVGLTTLGFLVGEQSIVAGGSDGSVNIFFRLATPGAGAADGFALTKAHELTPQPAAIVAFDASDRSKMFVTADAAGNIWVRHSTSEQTLLKLRTGATNISAVSLSPRENAVVAVAGNGKAFTFSMDAPHPETTLQTIFGKIWYENYPEASYTWQSSSGTDAFEPKFSLAPLIFGTVKAAFYSLMFAIPIALCGAIYTSQFLGGRVRGVVKPAMEMMASLPSVVLGFIAALILAPIVENWIGAVVLAFVCLPLSLFAGAYLWQLLPQPVAQRAGGGAKLLFVGASLFAGLYAAIHLAPLFEQVFFDGDFRAWTSGAGSSQPFMTLLFWPIAFVGLVIFIRTIPALSGSGRAGDDGARELVRWLAMLALSLALAAGLAALSVWAGMDVRGSFVGTYVQRNTLVVGFAMGFAVIPIMYTIAEDALTAVPEHLRAASLSCGATPWQTAIRVILPTALSGIFAAVMIGLGRAVGETMIVVMAAGNTPIIDWNIFSGLRALSANIAVELPEAVKDGTLYRMLFLAALTLFIMTFVLNTIAELVRLRFRKRAAQL
ncbi:ABC transporter permease subunit [Rhodomicrobium vannielii ATCC 17100]|uniref:ABC transporter permease subunit n=1 Tax=Rhodomicrobium vannielii TaxID=1069 RepID=UPI001917F5B5|nr:ABC transporter permease subunit [Rhodomicrobium vannielii]MBJ7532908.1 ABC transporter permease subunit [Rhodomicrobium vannielii ATCC 17100]